MENYEEIFDKYVSHPTDDRYVYTKVDRESLEERLFSKDIDKSSIEYLVLLAIWYGVINKSAIGDFIDWGMLQQEKAT